MIPALREAFNRNFSPETYQRFLESLAKDTGTPIAFRVWRRRAFFQKCYWIKWWTMAVIWSCSS